MGAQIEIKDLKGIVRRRKKIARTLFTIILFIGLCVALYFPPIYRAQVKLLVEGQQISEEYVKSSINSFMEDRLHKVTREIMNHSKLIEIIDAYHLYPEIREKKPIELAVEKMRRDITLEINYADIVNRQNGKFGAATLSFTLYYEGEKSETVQKVTNVLANLYVEEDVKTREKLAMSTSDFIRKELAEIKRKILQHEKRIADYKAKHLGELPQNMGSNLQSLARVDRDLDRTNSRIRALEDRKIYLEGQIVNVNPLKPVITEDGKIVKNPKEFLKGLRLQLIRFQTTLSDKHPDIIHLKKEIRKLEEQVGKTDSTREKIKRLNELKTELALRRTKLGENHPDVVKLSREVSFLSKSLEEELASLTFSTAAEEKPDNPAYINLMTQLVAVNAEMKAILKEREEIKREIEKYERRIEISPLIEQEYTELTRDYESAKHKYNELMKKFLNAETAREMVLSQSGEKFLITEYAALPVKPFKPHRIKIILLALVLAIGTAIGIAAFLEGIDDSIKSEDQLSELTGLPVLTSIIHIESVHEKRNRFVKSILRTTVLAGIIIVGLKLIHSYIVPLEILWSNVQMRLAEMGIPIANSSMN